MGEQRARLPRLAPLAIAAMLLTSECRADWRIAPALTLTERYTDNFRQENNELKRSQFISELTPSLTLSQKGPRLVLDGVAQWRHFGYRDDDLRDTLDHSFEYTLAGRGTLSDDFLFVDASASARPNNISAFGPRVEDTPYLTENQVKIKTWRISPYLERRFGQEAMLSVRYARDRVEGGNVLGFANSNGDSVLASLRSGPAFSRIGWGLTHVRQEQQDPINGDTSSTSTNADLRYALNPRFGLTATTGYDRYRFEGLGSDTAGRNWSLGFDWVPSLRTRVSAAIGRHFYGQTGNLTLSHRSRRTVWNMVYDDRVTTSREQFLLPATLDTSALLDQLLSASITDPALRQQAVASYIRNNGLPSSLSDSINFLSNRYFRQKGLSASMAFNLPRTSGVLSLSSTERIALSTQQSDSALLGSQSNALNDNVRQQGANASVNYRLNSRSSATASASWSRSRSITTDLEDTRRDFRVGLARQLGRHTRASVDLSRRSGTSGLFGLNTRPFQEHAISASLSVQL